MDEIFSIIRSVMTKSKLDDMRSSLNKAYQSIDQDYPKIVKASDDISKMLSNIGTILKSFGGLKDEKNHSEIINEYRSFRILLQKVHQDYEKAKSECKNEADWEDHFTLVDLMNTKNDKYLVVQNLSKVQWKKS